MGRPKAALAADAPYARLAQLLRELRQAAGLTYRQMAAQAIGVSAVTLSRADRGDALPSWKTVDVYLKTCGADAEQAARVRRAWLDARSAPRRTPAGPRRAPAPHPPRLDMVATPAQLVMVMRHLRSMAGQPPLRELQKRAEKAGDLLPRSSLADVLAGVRPPSLDLLLAFVSACLQSRGGRIPAAYAGRVLWAQAWQLAVVDRALSDAERINMLFVAADRALHKASTSQLESILEAQRNNNRRYLASRKTEMSVEEAEDLYAGGIADHYFLPGVTIG